MKLFKIFLLIKECNPEFKYFFAPQKWRSEACKVEKMWNANFFDYLIIFWAKVCAKTYGQYNWRIPVLLNNSNHNTRYYKVALLCSLFLLVPCSIRHNFHWMNYLSCPMSSLCFSTCCFCTSTSRLVSCSLQNFVLSDWSIILPLYVSI